MELKEGYKRTEIGVIPDDWNLESVGDHFQFKNGLNKAKKFFGHGTPIINYMDVFSHPGLKREYVRGLVSLSSDERRNYSAKKGDVFFTRTSETLEEVGMSSVLLEDINDASFSGFVLRARQRGDRFAHHFCQFCFRTEEVRKQITSKGSYTTRALTNGRALSAIEVPLPPTRAEQEAIAEALSDADALIESLEQLISKKRQIKQGTMQELLTGRTRLPGFSGKWKAKTLIELAGHKRELFNDGDWVEAEHITTEGVRLVQTGNIGEGIFIDRAERKYIYEDSFSSLRCKELRVGDLLICRLADPAGRACVLPDLEEEKVITSVDVTICRFPSDQADRTFLANLFSTGEWFKAVSDRSGGTTHKRIARGALGRIPILLPGPEEQTAIAEILSDMDTEIAALEAKLVKARQLEQGMMQELLSGNTRLIQPEETHA